MAQIFKRRSNVLARVIIVGGGALAGGALVLLMTVIARSSYVTGQFEAIEQPIQFSHKHHAGELGIDCRYCHTQVEQAAFAGIPPTKTCINCHSQIWTEAPILEPVRASYRDDKPLKWIRIHDLPDFAYFNHSVHVHKGIGCATCHGRIDEMNQVYQQSSLQMEWCLDCHRNPEQYIRPRDQVFNMAWRPDGDQLTLGRELVKAYDVHPRTDCDTCHR